MGRPGLCLLDFLPPFGKLLMDATSSVLLHRLQALPSFLCWRETLRAETCVI